MEWMTLVAKLTLDDSGFGDQLEKNKKKTSVFGDVLKANLASSAIQNGISSLANGVKSVAGGFKDLAVSAVQGFADSEQLVGGIETLFGKDNMGKVLENANNAFKTAGLSANEYMSTTIESAAAMISSLGGDQAKAAEMMDMSITDMSDNANKMGTSMEGLQNAYRGFSRGNFTMLDNLALGYAGTKEGMQELLKKAEELEAQQGRSTKYSIDSYADIVQAIHVVQTEMGITGTTAAEADKTISGSFSSMQMAWQNLINGFANGDADISQLITNVVSSAKTFLKNVIPAFKQAIRGIGQLIREVAPVLEKELPGLIDDVVPVVVESAITIMNSIVNSLPKIIGVLADALPSALKQIIPVIVRIFPDIIRILHETIPTIIMAVVESLQEAWPAVIDTLNTAFGEMDGSFFDYIATFIDKGVEMIGTLAEGIGNALPDLIPKAIDAILTFAETIVDHLDEIIDAGIKIIFGLAEGLINALPTLIEKIPVIIQKIVIALVNAIPKIAEAGVKLFSALVKSLSTIIKNIVSAVPKIITGIGNAFKKGFQKMKDIGKNLLKGLGNGIVEGAKSVVEKAKKVAGNVLDAVKGFFGVNSPSKVFHRVGGYLMEGLAKGIDDNTGLVDEAMNALNTSVEVGAQQMQIEAPQVQGQTFAVPRQTPVQQHTVILELDRMQFGRVVYTVNDEETQRIGVKLAGGYA